jgi:hypothetical protein
MAQEMLPANIQEFIQQAMTAAPALARPPSYVDDVARSLLRGSPDASQPLLRA